MKALEDPCIECLVRPCCKIPCSVVRKFILAVLELEIENPHHRAVDRLFSSDQAMLVRSTADIIRRNRINEEGKNTSKP